MYKERDRHCIGMTYYPEVCTLVRYFTTAHMYTAPSVMLGSQYKQARALQSICRSTYETQTCLFQTCSKNSHFPCYSRGKFCAKIVMVKISPGLTLETLSQLDNQAL